MDWVIDLEEVMVWENCGIDFWVFDVFNINDMDWILLECFVFFLLSVLKLGIWFCWDISIGVLFYFLYIF